MKTTLTTLSFLALMSTSAMAQMWPEPAQQAKAGARWWWLGSALDKENVTWNMEQYANHGIGALEITPLYGVQGNAENNIDYLSPKWMDMLKYVQSEGQRLGIQIDMNNGTGWPFGGPSVSLEQAACKVLFVDSIANEKVLKKGITIAVSDKEKKYSKLDVVMAFPKNVKGYTGGAIDVTASVTGETLTWKAPKKGDWRIIALYVGRTRQQVKRAAPGGQGYVIDHFDKQAVADYLKIFDEAFEKSNTPWPNTMFNDSYEVYGADWTPSLLKEFKARRGYDLTQQLDKFVDGDTKLVADYRETLSDLLLENFTNQWTSWAHSHGMITRNQAHGSPANLIDVYAAVDIPEIEGFGLTDFGIRGLRKDPGKTRPNDSDFSMLKYAPSAAHITGKNLVSSETFTWLTEHFRTSLSQMKPDLDLMFVAGVNHMYFHGTCYSPQDDPWPGWKFYASVDMSPTNSIWRDAPSLMKYIERCQSVLQMGTPDNDFLVYFPIHNLWNRSGNRLQQLAIHNMGKVAPEFRKSILELDALGYDCDYISDKFLLGTSFDGKNIVTEAGIKYKGLVIPADAILTDALKAHIDALVAKGAKVIYGNDAKQLAAAAKPEAIRTDLGLKTIRRKNDTGYHYFIANLIDEDIDAVTPLAVDCEYAVWLDPMTGRGYEADLSDKGVRISLRSGESLILKTFNKEEDGYYALDTCIQRKVKPIESTVINVTDGWTFSFMDEWSDEGEKHDIGTLTTWEKLDSEEAKTFMGTGVYETTFNIPTQKGWTVNERGQRRSTVLKPGDVSYYWAIDLGDVRESARVYINDEYMGCAWAVPYVLQFPGVYLKPGENKLRIEVTNLPANSIAELDRQGVKWRKFEEINVVDINYKKTTYADWEPMPSGLNSTVKIYAVE